MHCPDNQKIDKFKKSNKGKKTNPPTSPSTSSVRVLAIVSSNDFLYSLSRHLTKMPGHRQLRLGQTHRLNALAERLSNSCNFRYGEVKMLLFIHQQMEVQGPIDRHRFRELLEIIFDITDDVMLDLVFRSFDKNNDEVVDDIEFVHGMSKILRGTFEQLTDFTYSVYDLNGDGGLSREELAHCLKGSVHSGFGLTEDEAEEGLEDLIDIAMSKLDSDGDGQITYPDFVHAVEHDALLMQAVGECLPTPKYSAAFQSLVTDQYHQSSALIPRTQMQGKRKNRKKTQKRRSSDDSLDLQQFQQSNVFKYSIGTNAKSFGYLKNPRTLQLAMSVKENMRVRAK